MYEIKLDDFVFPIAAKEVNIDRKRIMETIKTLDGRTMYVPKTIGSTTINLNLFLPWKRYPFAIYGNNGFKTPDYYIKRIIEIMDKRQIVTLKINRKDDNGKKLCESDFRVFIENIVAAEDVENGGDVVLDLVLKEFKDFKPHHVMYKEYMAEKHAETAVKTLPPRETKNKPVYTTYTVVKGDCLSSIAEKCMGDGSKYIELYFWNQELIDKANFGTGNPRFTIYAGQVLNIPPISSDVTTSTVKQENQFGIPVTGIEIII